MSDRKAIGIVYLLGFLMYAMLNLMGMAYGYSPGIGLAAAIVSVAIGITLFWERWV